MPSISEPLLVPRPVTKPPCLGDCSYFACFYISCEWNYTWYIILPGFFRSSLHLWDSCTFTEYCACWFFLLCSGALIHTTQFIHSAVNSFLLEKEMEAIMNIQGHLFVKLYAHTTFLLDIYIGVGLLGHGACVCPDTPVSHSGCALTPLPAMRESSGCSTSSPIFGTFCVFLFSHFGWFVLDVI